MKRREFIKLSAFASGALMLPTLARRAYGAFLRTRPLRKFIQPLRRFGVEIPVLTPNTTTYPGVHYYQVEMNEFTDLLHPELGGETTLWGYGAPGGPFKHLGGAIVAEMGTPVRVRWTNNLPGDHPLPVDYSVIDPYVSDPAIAVNRAAPHLHGGLVPWPSDGGPFHWFSSTRDGAPRVTGESVVYWLPDAGGGMTDDYWYPNDQTPRFMWYHDHAVGITRLNAYAGLASGYILTGPAEAILMSQLAIPATRQIPLVVQDKVFQPNGKLWYPDFYDTQFFDLDEDDAELPLPSPSLVPEFWGDTMLVNGTVYPYLDVEPRRYRLRILNACNTRFLSLRLLGTAGRTFPDNTEADAANPGPTLLCIGTEGGFLDGTVVPKGVTYDNTAAQRLLLAPAERADIVVDFSNVKTTDKDPLCFVLYNDAPVPFPGGTPLADFHLQNRRLEPPPSPGYGPNTRTLLQFRVLPLGAVTGDTNPDAAPDPTWTLPPAPVPAQTVPMPRDLALFETEDDYGRLAQQLGPLSGPLEFTDPATEVVQAGTVEVWRIFNVSADTHPIHFHYFNVRVVSRQRFRLAHGRPVFNGAPEPPEPGEQGWKETVRMNPGECTTLVAEMPSTAGLAPPGVSIPDSPRTAGHEYVWHCHILEHEEHDMMRPLIVMP